MNKTINDILFSIDCYEIDTVRCKLNRLMDGDLPMILKDALGLFVGAAYYMESGRMITLIYNFTQENNVLWPSKEIIVESIYYAECRNKNRRLRKNGDLCNFALYNEIKHEYEAKWFPLI